MSGEEIFRLPSHYEEDLKTQSVRYPHYSNVWTIGSILSLAASLATLLTMLAGGLWFFARLDISTKEIPTIQLEIKEQGKQIAILQDQQKFADSRYAEIMLQLARIDAKLDKQNDYLLNRLNSGSHSSNSRQKNNPYSQGNSSFPRIFSRVSTGGTRYSAPSQ